MKELMGKVTTPDEDDGGALTIKVWASGRLISPIEAIAMAIKFIEGVIVDTTDIKGDPNDLIRNILDSNYAIEKISDSSKKTVRLSNLAMRFYKKDGWSEELLLSCVLESQEFPVTTMDKGESEEYYIYDMTAKVDKVAIKKYISKVIPGFKEQTTDPEKAIEGYLN